MAIAKLYCTLLPATVLYCYTILYCYVLYPTMAIAKLYCTVLYSDPGAASVLLGDVAGAVRRHLGY